MPFKPGHEKHGGRVKGTENKNTATVKAALQAAFDGIGGIQRLQQYAQEEPGEFYKLWIKILPQEVNHGSQSENPLVIYAWQNPEQS